MKKTFVSLKVRNLKIRKGPNKTKIKTTNNWYFQMDLINHIVLHNKHWNIQGDRKIDWNKKGPTKLLQTFFSLEYWLKWVKLMALGIL